ncbi:MFS transporter [Jatrophihabitans sp.]|uniref:MFS transporter n=1 Tax=Jatrophihabitans sp. TaxID=1932789 RepID=UPI0030C6A8A6|nr:transporter [Jatrophihabitans sp.]
MSEVSAPDGREGGRGALAGWGLAVSVYFLAVFHRSSLGVAGLIAEHRFHITPSQLSVFVLLQVGVYAAMQVPTGVLVDRYGPRRVLVVASLLMGSAQLLFSLVSSYPLALLARAVLGCGDALTFISVLRYTAGHFSARRFPVLVTVTAMVGTLGNIMATLPLAALLRHAGWFTGYSVAAGLSLLAALLVLLLLNDHAVAPAPLREVAQVREGLGAVRRRVVTAWGLPGTRLGFWAHFASGSVSTAFSVLWGLPYLVKGVGYSTTTASLLLLLGVLLAAGVSPVIGTAIGRHPVVRIPIALVITSFSVVAWAVVSLGLGDHPPRGLVGVLFVLTLLGGPGSMVAFAVARDYNPAAILGTASGVVNVGGFLAAVIIAMGFGWVLDALGGSTPHAMRWALLVCVGVQGVGLMRVVVWYRRVRALIRREQLVGRTVPVPVGRVYWWDVHGSMMGDVPSAIDGDAESLIG